MSPTLVYTAEFNRQAAIWALTPELCTLSPRLSSPKDLQTLAFGNYFVFYSVGQL